MEFIKKDKVYNQGIVGETIKYFSTNMSMISSERTKNLVIDLLKMEILD